jgi:hypothetical protein
MSALVRHMDPSHATESYLTHLGERVDEAIAWLGRAVSKTVDCISVSVQTIGQFVRPIFERLKENLGFIFSKSFDVITTYQTEILITGGCLLLTMILGYIALNCLDNSSQNLNSSLSIDS